MLKKLIQKKMDSKKEVVVCKFGGSSVGSSTQIRKVFEIIRSDARRKIVVVSAPKGVTDLLILCAKKYHETKKFSDNDFEKIKLIYDEIGSNLGVSDAVGFELDELKSRIKTNISSKKEYDDYVKAWGEKSNAKIIAEFFTKAGLEAEYLSPRDAGLYVSEDFGNARVLYESIDNMKRNIKTDKVVLFPGFFGVTKTGRTATFSRGGSDLTGSLVAAAVNAKVYENWTDQDGIRNADPNIVKEPKNIKEITYKEIRELAYMGFKVFHAEAMIPAMRSKIPINIKNTNNPTHPGTMIVDSRENNGAPIIGVSSRKGFAIFNVEKILMDAEVGFGRRLLEIFESKGLSYEHTPSGIDSISVILTQQQLNDAMIKEIVKDIKEKLNPEKIDVELNKCLICVVGNGLKRTPGISSKITGALAKVSVNIEILNQGASEISLIIGIEEKDNTKAVNAIYNEFF